MRAPSPRRPSGGAERYDGAVITAGVRVVLGSDDSMYKPCGLNFSLISLYYKSAPRAKRRQKRVSEVSRARLRLRQKRRRSADTIPQNPPGEGWSVAKPSATSPPAWSPTPPKGERRSGAGEAGCGSALAGPTRVSQQTTRVNTPCHPLRPYHPCRRPFPTCRLSSPALRSPP